MVTVNFMLDDAGYIVGWENVKEGIEIEESKLFTIAFGRSRYADGEIITDGPEIPEPPAPPTMEELIQENAELKTRIVKLATQQELTDGAVMDLATMLLTR